MSCSHSSDTESLTSSNRSRSPVPGPAPAVAAPPARERWSQEEWDEWNSWYTHRRQRGRRGGRTQGRGRNQQSSSSNARRRRTQRRATMREQTSLASSSSRDVVLTPGAAHGHAPPRPSTAQCLQLGDLRNLGADPSNAFGPSSSVVSNPLASLFGLSSSMTLPMELRQLANVPRPSSSTDNMIVQIAQLPMPPEEIQSLMILRNVLRSRGMEVQSTQDLMDVSQQVSSMRALNQGMTVSQMATFLLRRNYGCRSAPPELELSRVLHSYEYPQVDWYTDDEDGYVTPPPVWSCPTYQLQSPVPIAQVIPMQYGCFEKIEAFPTLCASVEVQTDTFAMLEKDVEPKCSIDAIGTQDVDPLPIDDTQIIDSATDMHEKDFEPKCSLDAEGTHANRTPNVNIGSHNFYVLLERATNDLYDTCLDLHSPDDTSAEQAEDAIRQCLTLISLMHDIIQYRNNRSSTNSFSDSVLKSYVRVHGGGKSRQRRLLVRRLTKLRDEGRLNTFEEFDKLQVFARVHAV